MERIKRHWYFPVAVDVRLTLYGVLAIVALYFVFFDRMEYTCNLPGRACPVCGMKTAVYHLLHFRFSQAYQSNSYVWLLVLFGAAMMADVVGIILHKKNKG